MAVYKKTYSRYEGKLTPLAWRFMVPVRFQFEEMRRSKFLQTFFYLTLIWPTLCALYIYITHNMAALRLMRLDNANILQPDERFFMTFLGFQCMCAFFLAAFIGPGLVAPDLSNNALPLYLARPYRRSDYVLSKMSVLVILLSLMTWVPGLFLFGLEGYLEGNEWFSANWRVASGLFFGSMLWILILAFLALALSAWVKWRPVAGALMFGVFFVASGFGAFINAVLRTKWGHLLNIGYDMGAIWVWLFQEPAKRGNGAVFFRIVQGEEIPLWCCWAALALLCALCLYLLSIKIRGVEVVK